MANNYSETSFMLPSSWPAEAKEDFFRIMQYVGCQAECSRRTEPVTGEYTIPSWVDVDTIFEDYIDEVETCEPEGEVLCAPQHFPGTVWKDGDDVGFYEEECYDPIVEVLLQRIADHYHIKRKHAAVVSSSYTCSKPRVGEFGGGDSEIYDRSTQPTPPCSGFMHIMGPNISKDAKLVADIEEAVDTALSEDDNYFPGTRVYTPDSSTIGIKDPEWFWMDKIVDTAMVVLRRHGRPATAKLVWIYKDDCCKSASGSMYLPCQLLGSPYREEGREA